MGYGEEVLQRARIKSTLKLVFVALLRWWIIEKGKDREIHSKWRTSFVAKFFT